MIKKFIFNLLDSFDLNIDCTCCPLRYYCDHNYNKVHGCSKVVAKYFLDIFSSYIEVKDKVKAIGEVSES